MTIDIIYTQILLAGQRLSSIDYFKVTESSYQHEKSTLLKEHTSKDISSVYIIFARYSVASGVLQTSGIAAYIIRNSTTPESKLNWRLLKLLWNIKYVCLVKKLQ
jgi:hypothetical protein